ncbi:MAG: phage major capsid protein, P2 family [Burkholderia gladioli]
MQPRTREALRLYSARIAELNGVSSATESFAVVPRVQQTLEKKIQESSAFLKSINIQGVPEQAGEKLGLLIGAPNASTTDTTDQERAPVDLTDMDSNPYFCSKTNSDTYIPYSKLDAWAFIPEFQAMIRDVTVQNQALDRLRIAFNGVSRAANSDRTKNPLGQDVNKGWLQKYREQAADQVIKDKIVIGGAAGHYKNLDALVMETTAELIAPWHADNPNLVVVCGRHTLLDKYFPIVNQNNRPTDEIAAGLIVSQKRMGGLQVVQAPFFPRGKVLITILSNLSIYWQIGARRKTILDNPKRDRVEFLESNNEAYVVEDFKAGCVIEDIEIADEPPPSDTGTGGGTGGSGGTQGQSNPSGQ